MKAYVLALALILCGRAGADEYTLGPESQRQPGVPEGAVTHHTWNTSKIFPGTTRDYWVYVPQQYKDDKPAAVMVFQDGGGFIKEDGNSRVPIVFDNLIAKGEMPVTIGIFIDPGVLPALNETAQNRYNRSYEYDSLSDRYVRFLLEEILPEVGKEYKLSADPNDRAIGGASSGGICAFTAAWIRPDAFRRVLSFIGSYTDLRGGDIYPALIHKTEPKPIRVFLQDGSNDMDIFAGDWWMGNQAMDSALKYAGYDYKFVTGTEGHNMKQGGAIMPDALRWLWRDYPNPIAKAKGPSNLPYGKIIDFGTDWELVGQGYKFTEGASVDKEGNFYFTDIPNNRIYKVAADGKPTVFKEDAGGPAGTMFGADGRLYVCQTARKRIAAYASDGTESVIADGLGCNDISVTRNGDVYVTDPSTKHVWLVNAKGEKRAVHEGMTFPNGVRLSSDHSLLAVDDSADRTVWSFQVQPDGSLTNGQKFYRLEIPDEQSNDWGDGITFDTEGFMYVATRYGVMACDQVGRTVAILNPPQPGNVSHVAFAGPDMQTLYITDGDKVYRRPMLRKGALPWEAVKPPVPRL